MSIRIPATRRIAAVVGPAALATLGVVLGLFAAVAVSAEPRTPGRVAAVFPPWWSATRVGEAAASAGNIAGAGGAPFVIILRGDPADLSRRTRAAGALMLIDPALAGVCARPAVSAAEV